ncbi:MAG: MBL fold metallo-hydrolase [Clostridiales bacterium]|nr:MBL fold metallo-hydrolase [Clostridiales bacterium]
MLKISPLFSGSKGNCTLIQSDNTNILLDVGLGYRAILKALESRALTPNNIDAIVITHEHSDHIGALQHWAQHFSTNIYIPSPIAHELGLRIAYAPAEVVEVNGSFTVGNVSIDVYECSHDAKCCLGYRFTSGDSRFACVTDTGCVKCELVQFLAPCSAIMLESNHDEDMLMKGDYSYPLKRRILSNYGHLSNAQATDILSQLVGSRVKNVILAHLSEKNNTRELAFNSAVSMYASRGLTEGKDVNVYVADQYENGITICID